MTDEEIVRRVAEIEGKRLSAVVCRPHLLRMGNYNPLANPSDTMALIEKYKPTMGWVGEAWTVFLRLGVSSSSYQAKHESLPHAICLAVIEAHKEEESMTSSPTLRRRKDDSQV